MMQRPRRFAACVVATGLLALGGITAGVEAAQANVAGFCDGSGATANCTVTETINAPTSVTVGVTASTNGEATVSWTASCTDSTGTTAATSGATMSETPVQVALLPLPATAGGTCTRVGRCVPPHRRCQQRAQRRDDLHDVRDCFPQSFRFRSSSSAPPSSGHLVQGYTGKCVDDAGNSSGNGAKVQIWTCSSFDKAQLWTYSNGELIHNNKCLNDKAWGGNGAKVILYSCNHALNELWTHQSNGQYVLNAKGYKLCLDDPAYSTRNGTQLIVYTCKDSANQRWSKP